jgi:8-oxo-dGTP pyrophosphatase MutT (NUDIX family)
MTAQDGNGWSSCGQGHRHWGRFGAAGLLAYAPDQAGETVVLLQRRAEWVHNGGTWGTPGGARDSHEDAAHAALREAAEECAVPAGAVTVRGELRDDHHGWRYETVIAQADAPFEVRRASSETRDVRWIPLGEVGSLPLHPGFADQWPVLREALQPLTVIVDGANVMGSRPDGWWRDRAGAARRLRDQLAGLAAAGVTDLPAELHAPPLDRWYPQFVLVVEGAARSVADDPAGPVRVIAAARSGDDEIADLARRLDGRRLVVTADRELRARCTAAGASVTGPGWLLARL